MEMPNRYLHLACQPPGFVWYGSTLARTAHLLRPVNYESGNESLPRWVAELPDQPTIYVTLGTIVSRWPTGLSVFAAVLEGLCDEPFNVVLTVGRANDPAQFGPQPSNVHIEHYIPQGLLLPYCDMVVQQGGFSTITGSLNAGLPMVLIPINYDQLYDAACCDALGVGKVIEPERRTPEAIREAVRMVLMTPPTDGTQSGYGTGWRHYQDRSMQWHCWNGSRRRSSRCLYSFTIEVA